jgi:cyanophycinase-like exopeptidase
MTRRLIVMGSGETSPTMVGVHREAFDSLGPQTGAVLLDTPYGFQENADELTERAREYFRISLTREVEPATFRSAKGASVLERETMITDVRLADYVFSGPGSPSYALEQWHDTPVAQLLTEKLMSHGAVVFASAAALTLGTFTIPVYEIYKVGHDPFWLPGLDVLGALGLSAVLVPHFDNAEGGTHDTRFCWMGARRFEELLGMLPSGLPVVGIDEHTAWTVDLDRDTFSVAGRGGVTLLTGDGRRVFGGGAEVSLDEMRTGAVVPDDTGELRRDPPVTVERSLSAALAHAQARFERAVEAADPGNAVASILTLLDALDHGNTHPHDAAARERARSALRSLVVRLGSYAGDGMIDRREVVGEFVDLALAARDRARAAGLYEEADGLRDGLDDLGIEVRDTPEGTKWDLR